ncbi:cyc8-general repressor of transcription [Pleurostoma richardsiae]|uniref:Cyc8-general repressor of transcription n=1 Tax=Pleurostoma richardsiae TaxID=41990 RepID=A0AA38VCX1_9PEZI|nr:cyc8-general repressor of transcription [Pleurostoma richardsiae]
MYSAPYGFPNTAAGQAFNGAPPPQNPQMQPGPSPNQPPQMMYNPQQFPMGAQGPFPGGPSPAAMMPGGAGPAGMMQNTAMPHMAANGQMSYQPPFTGSPYGAGVPTTAPPHGQFPPNMMMGGSMGGFPMNAAGMAPQQQMMPRMHPSQQNAAAMGMSTPQRPFGGSQGTPTSSMPSQQGHVSTPQNAAGTPQSAASAQAQPPSTNITTPQTPTFPSTGQMPNGNGTSASTPLSPGTESREKERFALLLEINQELLCESILLQNTHEELKKEHAAVNSDGAAAGDKEKEMTEEEKLVHQDYVQCLRRLQANLSYLALLADKKNPVQVPPCPAYLSPPPLNLSIKLKGQIPGLDPNSEKTDPSADREGRDRYIKDLYKKLQALFPGIDPRKEPAYPPPNQAARGGSAASAAQQRPHQGQGPVHPNSAASPGQGHKTPQMAAASAPQTHAIATS